MAVSANDDGNDSAEQPLLRRKIVLVDYQEVASFQAEFGGLPLGFTLEPEDVILEPGRPKRPLERGDEPPALPRRHSFDVLAFF